MTSKVAATLSLLSSAGDDDSKAAVALLKLAEIAGKDHKVADEVHRLNGVSSVMSAIRSRKERKVKLQGILAMGNLCVYSDMMRQQFADQGALEMIVETLKAYPEDAEMTSKCFYTLGRLASLLAVADAFIEQDGVEIVISALLKWEDNDKVVERALATLVRLAETNTHKEVVSNAAGIPLALAALNKWMKHAKVVTAALRVLDKLATHAGNKHRIAEADGLPLVVKAVYEHSKSPIVQTIALHLLGRLAYVEEFSATFAGQGALEAVLATIKRFSSDRHVLTSGLAALASLAFLDDNKAKIGDLGGVEVVLSTLKKHPAVTSVQEEGLYALSSLAFFGSNKVRISKLGGVGVAIDALDNYADDADIQLIALRTLARLAVQKVANDQAVKRNAAVLIVRALKNYGTQNSQVTGNALAAAASMALYESSRQALVRANVVPPLLAAMRAWSSASDIMLVALHCMSRLAASAEVAAELATSETAVLLLDILRAEKSVWLSGNGLAALAKLAGDAKRAPVVRDNGGVNVVIALLEKYPTNAYVQGNGLSTLASLAELDASKSEIRDLGGIELAVTAMQLFTGQVALQSREEAEEEIALEFLGRKSKPEHRRKLDMRTGRGDNELVFTALEKYDGNAYVHANALGLLARLSIDEENNRRFGRLGGVKLTLAALKDWPNTPIILEEALFAIGHLAIIDQHRSMMLTQNAVKAVVDAVRRWRARPLIAANGLAAIASLAIDSSGRDRISGYQGVDLIVELLKTYAEDSAVQFYALFALGKVATVEAAATALGTLGAAPLVVAAMTNGDSASSPDKVLYGLATLANMAQIDGNHDGLIAADVIPLVCRVMRNAAKHEEIARFGGIVLSHLSDRKDVHEALRAAGAKDVIKTATDAFPADERIQENEVYFTANLDGRPMERKRPHKRAGGSRGSRRSKGSRGSKRSLGSWRRKKAPPAETSS